MRVRVIGQAIHRYPILKACIEPGASFEPLCVILASPAMLTSYYIFLELLSLYAEFPDWT